MLEQLGYLAPRIILVAAACVFPVLFFIAAPYGRHERAGFGPTLSARLGWVVMESPSFFLFGALWWLHPARGEPVVFVLGLLWLLHYGQRTFVFTALMREQGKVQPVLTVGLAIVFNLLNASGNALGLAARPIDAAFVVGGALFLTGFGINVYADHLLRTLRAPGETGYKIPRGGPFRWVSAPNYLGEIVEWVGFALAAQSLAGWAFAAFTVANLAPRAWSHHKWYREKFADYPLERRALVPYLW